VLVTVATLAWPAARLTSQSTTVTAVNGLVRVQAPGFHFIEGAPLARLKDGQSVRVVLELSVLGKPGAAAAQAQGRQTFILSYDLWEERFAVTSPGVAAGSVSHLTSTAAEAWCLEQLTVPLSALGPLRRNVPFWIRLGYRVLDGAGAADRDEDAGLTLAGLVELLSPRRKSGEVARSIEAGPFRVGQ
jgi:hypothetical protein